MDAKTLLKKRDATQTEIEAQTAVHRTWLEFGCDIEDPDEWLADQNEKNKEHKAETCDCGVTMLCFQHFVRCDQQACPFKDGKGTYCWNKSSQNWTEANYHRPKTTRPGEG